MQKGSGVREGMGRPALAGALFLLLPPLAFFGILRLVPLHILLPPPPLDRGMQASHVAFLLTVNMLQRQQGSMALQSGWQSLS